MIDATATTSVLKIASEIERFGEVVAGSNREKQVLEVIREHIEDYVDEFWIESVPVTTWREDVCVIEVRGSNVYCTLHPPYQGVIDEEIDSALTTISLEELLERRQTLSSIHDRVVLIDMPRDPDDISIVAYILAQYEPRLIIIRDVGENLRRIVVLNSVIALYRRASQLRTPVIHIRRSTGSINKLAGGRVYARSEAYRSYGYNVIAILNKRHDNRYIYMTAHHDHWLSGGSDNIIGVSITAALSKILRNANISDSIVLAFFTAEEGFPENISSFYWLVGSKHHVNKNADRIIDSVSLVINIDTVYRAPLTVSTSSTVVRGIVRSYFRDLLLEHDSIAFDSFTFTSIGVPSITFNTFKQVLDKGVYHSDRDFVSGISLDIILKTIESVYRLISVYSDISENAKHVDVCSVDEELRISGRAPPIELLINLYRVCGILSKLRESHRYSILTNLFNRIVSTSYVDKDVGSRLGVRERTDFIKCDERSIFIPTGFGFKDIHECHRSTSFNLELLAYILLKHYS